MGKTAKSVPLQSNSDLSEHDIVERIVAAVMEQRLPPGMKLSEAKLCESFGVGRMRIRRALLLLANQGVVDLHSNRGAFVAGPDAREARDVFSAREILETAIVRTVALSARPEDVDELERHIGLEREARERRDRPEAIRLSGEFHIKVAQASENAVLARMLRELVTRSSLIIGLYGTRGVFSCPEHEHADTVAAIRERDPDKAENLMRRHISHIQSDLDLSSSKPEEADLVELLRRT